MSIYYGNKKIADVSPEQAHLYRHIVIYFYHEPQTLTTPEKNIYEYFIIENNVSTPFTSMSDIENYFATKKLISTHGELNNIYGMVYTDSFYGKKNIGKVILDESTGEGEQSELPIIYLEGFESGAYTTFTSDTVEQIV